jgi:hypothetical protein
MKPYGLFGQYLYVEHPDVLDIQFMGAKSSTGRLREKGGDFKPYSRTTGKRRVRRMWKRKARQAAKTELVDY